MQSMGRSMDWTLEDNMDDGFFFCVTLTSRRRGHKLSGCVVGTNGCLNQRCRAFPSGGQVSARWSRCPGFMDLHVGGNVALLRLKLSRLDHRENRKIVRWCRTQASSHSSQGVIDNKISEAGVSTAAPDRSVVLCY